MDLLVDREERERAWAPIIEQANEDRAFYQAHRRQVQDNADRLILPTITLFFVCACFFFEVVF